MLARDWFDCGTRLIGLVFFLNYVSQWWLGALGWIINPAAMTSGTSSFGECLLYGLLTSILAAICVFRGDLLTNLVYGPDSRFVAAEPKLIADESDPVSTQD